MAAQNTVVWADIPVTDMERAKRFYGALLGVPVMEMPGSGGTVALLPALGGQPAEGETVVSADLAMGDDQKPSAEGVTVYLTGMGDIEGMIARVEPAGGRVLQRPQDMGPMIGVIALIMDSEGNRIGIQQPSPQKRG